MKPQSLEKRRKKDALLTDREKLQAGTHTTISHTKKRRKIITVTRTYFFFLECVTFRTSCSESSYSKWGRGGLNILFFLSSFLPSFLPPLPSTGTQFFLPLCANLKKRKINIFGGEGGGGWMTLGLFWHSIYS